MKKSFNYIVNSDEATRDCKELQYATLLNTNGNGIRQTRSVHEVPDLDTGSHGASTGKEARELDNLQYNTISGLILAERRRSGLG